MCSRSEIPLVTWFNFHDLLDTRFQKLLVHGVYVPPLFLLMTPAYRNHIPYLVLYPSGARWARWSIANQDAEHDIVTPSIPIWYNFRKSLAVVQ